MKKYRKLIASIVGLALLAAARYGLDLTEHEQAITDLVLSALTAYGVFQLPNART